MRWSKAGLVVAACYLALAGVLLLTSTLMDDLKGVVVFMQLAVLPGLAILRGLGLDEVMIRNPWLNTIPAMLLFNLVLAYGLGWAAAGLVGLFKRGATRHG